MRHFPYKDTYGHKDTEVWQILEGGANGEDKGVANGREEKFAEHSLNIRRSPI